MTRRVAGIELAQLRALVDALASCGGLAIVALSWTDTGSLHAEVDEDGERPALLVVSTDAVVSSVPKIGPPRPTVPGASC
jgi:hypothetical protein